MMDKEMFLNLNTEKQIDYLNKQLKEGNTVIRIREDLGIGEKKLQKIIKLNGYKYDQKIKQYIKVNQVIHDYTKVIHNENNNTNDVVIHNVIHDVIQVDNIKYFNDNFELFKTMIERFKEGMNNYNNTSNIVINLQDDTHLKRNPRPVRINAFVEDKWKLFCEENKKFTKKELLSMALKEYMEKYN